MPICRKGKKGFSKFILMNRYIMLLFLLIFAVLFMMGQQKMQNNPHPVQVETNGNGTYKEPYEVSYNIYRNGAYYPGYYYNYGHYPYSYWSYGYPYYYTPYYRYHTYSHRYYPRRYRWRGRIGRRWARKGRRYY